MSPPQANPNIDELEKKAFEILALRQKSRPRRPIVIEFCGSPKAGKTSTISALNIFLKRNGFRTRLLTERAGVCPVSDKTNPLFNIWTSSAAICELAHCLAEGAKDLDVILSDRGVFDALGWFQWLRDHKHMDQAEFTAQVAFLTTKRWRACLDLVYVFSATPEKSMEREYATLLTRKTGSIMNEHVLSSFRDAIATTVSGYGSAFRCVETIDTSNLDQNEVSYRVTSKSLDSLLDLIVEQVGYVSSRQILGAEEKDFFRFSETGLSQSILRFGRRDLVERDPGAVQPIPIAVICNHERSKVLVLKKSASGTSSDSIESGHLLGYAGGHIRREDRLEGEVEPFLSIARTALSREIQEELGIALQFTDEDPLCFWTRETRQSRRHIAICFLYESSFEQIQFKLDPYEFIQRKGSSKSGRLIPVRNLLKEDLEPWTKLILEHYFNARPQKDLFSV